MKRNKISLANAQACGGFLLRASALALAATLLMSVDRTSAESYPSRPVHVIVPFPGGTSTDLVGRQISEILSKANGSPFVVENKPGAQGVLGARMVARSPNDGYTLLIGNNTTQAAAPALFKDLKYDPNKDFEPIAKIGSVVLILTVRSDLPVKSTEDLIAYGKAHPGQLRWGYANSANDVAGAAVARIGGFKAIKVPYKGVPQMTMDLVGGQIDFAVSDFTNTMPMVNAGKLRALAVASPEPIDDLPNIPTLAKTLKGFTLFGWYGVFAPAGTPKEITTKLSKQILAGLNTPGPRELLKRSGIFLGPGGSEELRSFAKSESEKWSGLIKDAGIVPQ